MLPVINHRGEIGINHDRTEQNQQRTDDEAFDTTPNSTIHPLIVLGRLAGASGLA